LSDTVEPSTQYAKHGDRRIAYQVWGEGPRELVIVPGFVSHLEVAREHRPYERYMQRLASFARVVVFDKAGSGLSDPLVGSETFEQRVDDIGAVMDAAGCERAAVMGMSEGASMTILFSAMHPERVDAAILYGTIVRSKAAEDFPWAVEDEAWQVGFEGIQEAWGEGATLFSQARGMMEDEGFRAWWSRFERMAASPSTALAALRLDAEIDIREFLPSVRVPTLVLHRQDDFWPVDQARYAAERIPDAKLVVLEGDSHWPWIGDTDAVTGEIEEFLTGARHAPEPDRILATVLFTDIVDSTGHAAKLGDRRWRSLLEDHESLVRRQLERFQGREVKTTGDGFLATFDGPARAVRCARAIAEEVRPLGIEVRAGLHAGECELRDSDVGGIAVHIGARVSAAAGAGEVLVSSTVKDLVAGSGIEFEERGECELKGVPGTWRLYAAA
jgi:class 3 adenylate cyclase